MPFSELWRGAAGEPEPPSLDDREVLRRSKQTSKARAASLKTRHQRSQNSAASEQLTWASSLQKNYFTRNIFHVTPGADHKKAKSERSRCGFSLATPDWSSIKRCCVVVFSHFRIQISHPRWTNWTSHFSAGYFLECITNPPCHCSPGMVSLKSILLTFD